MGSITKRGDVAAAQLAGQGADVAERDHVGPREQRAETAAELTAAVEGEGPGRQPVEGVVAVEDARPLRRGADELDRTLDRLGARVGEEDPLDAGMGPLDQLLGQDAGQERTVHLHEVGQVGVERVVQRLDDGRVAPAQGEHPEAGEEVEVPLPLVVDEVAALALLEEAAELDGAEDPRQLRVDVLRMEAEILALAILQHLLQFKGHAAGSRSIGVGWVEVMRYARTPP